MNKTLAYKRPYKSRSESRSEHRDESRRKRQEAKDRKFLMRVASAVALVLMIALGIAAKGVMDKDDPSGQLTEVSR
ncbi:hypothetical protein IC235_15270 [Hymenobacter sp. BT664]|uniref:Uncharacterized protein n=1 Tax=Hymenobacter montanus TaxID=2771359 RepID=A0A927BEA2_9BACT|nr:hypothetical protein [Hymenobacter montanus]MBD2769251.1 hypothetical protein [Hymenobacter montanus]